MPDVVRVELFKVFLDIFPYVHPLAEKTSKLRQFPSHFLQLLERAVRTARQRLQEKTSGKELSQKIIIR